METPCVFSPRRVSRVVKPWQVALGSMDMDALLDSIPKLEERVPGFL